MGCYAASVDTGLHPSTKTIKKPWASCWIFGLVPPSTIVTAAECPNGVARVETQLSFLNQVVSIVTFGIYTPMQVVVTCAERESMSYLGFQIDIVVRDGATQEEVQDAFAQAAHQAANLQRPVFIQL